LVLSLPFVSDKVVLSLLAGSLFLAAGATFWIDFSSLGKAFFRTLNRSSP
jgi:hypothetical protein